MHSLEVVLLLLYRYMLVIGLMCNAPVTFNLSLYEGLIIFRILSVSELQAAQPYSNLT